MGSISLLEATSTNSELNSTARSFISRLRHVNRAALPARSRGEIRELHGSAVARAGRYDSGGVRKTGTALLCLYTRGGQGDGTLVRGVSPNYLFRIGTLSTGVASSA